MNRRMVLIGLLGVGAVVMWAADASAHSAGYRLKADGTLYHASSVACQFVATGTGKDVTSTGVCEVIPDPASESLLFCLNPTNHKISGEAASVTATFNSASAVGKGDKKGKTTYKPTAEADGVAESAEECEQIGEACANLRLSCVNPNWVPFDVVPVSFTSVIKVYACPSTGCPNGCSPDGAPGLPPCVDHNLLTPEIDPEDTLTYSCTWPENQNPDDYEFGDILQYSCSLVP